MRHATPSQTVGPFFSFGLCNKVQSELVAPGSEGAIRISGRVLDGGGEPVPDAMVEVWDPAMGWGRSPTDAEGRYGFIALRTPHLAMTVFARGLLKQVVTRLYFPGEDQNATDPLLAALPEDERAALTGEWVEADHLRFDIHLQGERQTPFFAL